MFMVETEQTRLCSYVLLDHSHTLNVTYYVNWLTTRLIALV